MPQPTPPLLLQAFAKNAASQYIQNPIPVSTVDTDRASLDLGFPPLTMTEIFAGGKPPWGQDMNGILYMLSADTAARQAGQTPVYNSTLASAMGGYATGAVVSMADGSGLWFNLTNGNTTDPDAGGAGWVPLHSYGYTTVSGLTGGTVTLSQAQARRNVIILTGGLVGNLTIVLPAWLKSWLIVNNTTGGFTTTIRSAAGGAGTVNVPQGGFSAPVEVYGDGSSMYPAVAPVNLPIDQNPTGLTIAQRTNAGYLFATYFNQNSPLENFAMSAVYADAGDGYHRKISPAHFAAQIALSQFAGQVANAQVPQSAVTQHAAAVLTNAALTGVPTAPTPPAGDNSTRVATTAFVQGALTPAQNGSVTLPNGLILKWGWASGAGGPGAFTIFFPVAFPNAIFAAFMSTGYRNTQGSNTYNFVGSIATSFMSVVADEAQFGPVAGSRNCYWFAIGN